MRKVDQINSRMFFFIATKHCWQQFLRSKGETVTKHWLLDIQFKHSPFMWLYFYLNQHLKWSHHLKEGPFELDIKMFHIVSPFGKNVSAVIFCQCPCYHFPWTPSQFSFDTNLKVFQCTHWQVMRGKKRKRGSTCPICHVQYFTAWNTIQWHTVPYCHTLTIQVPLSLHCLY